MEVTSTRFLGVVIDEKLSWKDIQFVCSKVMKSVGIFRKISGLVHQACFLILYYSLINCNIVWASTYASYLHKLLIIQNTFNYLAPSAPLFKELNILSIYNINVSQLCTFIYKYSYLPDSLPNPSMDSSMVILKSIYITQDTAKTFILPTAAPHIVNSLSDIEVP